MACPGLEQLERYALGDASPASGASIESHVKACNTCLGAVAELKRNLGLVGMVAKADAFFQDETIVPSTRTDHTGFGAGGPLAIPGYELQQEVSTGGQGVVYRALQQSTQRAVAIKVLRAGYFADAHERARFEREVHILGRLKHPNIVAIYDSGQIDGRPFFVMDYIQGVSLDGYVESQPSPPGRSSRRRPHAAVLTLFATVCEAVHAAHLRGIIHRDLKPSNVVVDDDGRPHILDFGLAKLTAEGEHEMTLAGQFLGSLPWSSPEQAEGDPGKIDVRTDIYALGVILYQLLTGRFPYDITGGMRDILARIAEQAPESPRSVTKTIDAELETIMLKCLAKDPARRYQSAGDLARDIHLYLAERPIEAKRDSALYLFRKALRRHRIAAMVGALVLVILCSATVVSLWFGFRQERIAREMRFSADTLRVLLQTRGRLRDSLPAFRDNLERARAEFGPDHPFTGLAEYNYGSILQAMREYEGAEREYSESLRIRRLAHGPVHPEVSQTLAALASVAAEQQKHERAAELYSGAIGASPGGDARGRRDRVAAHLGLGQALISMKKYPEAETHLGEARREFDPGEMPVHLDFTIVSAFVRLYEDWNGAEPNAGHDAEAARWKKIGEELPRPEGLPPPEPPDDFGPPRRPGRGPRFDERPPPR